MRVRTVQRLIIGGRFTGFTVSPDQKCPSIWRVRHPHGRLSNTVNLTRAKDVALAFARPQGLGNSVARWERMETPLRASSARENGAPHVTLPRGA
jgi:hypothetical protein